MTRAASTAAPNRHNAIEHLVPELSYTEGTSSSMVPIVITLTVLVVGWNDALVGCGRLTPLFVLDIVARAVHGAVLRLGTDGFWGARIRNDCVLHAELSQPELGLLLGQTEAGGKRVALAQISVAKTT